MRNEEQYVVFLLGREEYGVRIQQVREIITMPTIRPIPQLSAGLLGLINLRGAVVPVFDLKSRLGLPTDSARPDPKVMIVEVGSQIIGCPVDEVSHVQTIPGDVIELPEILGDHDDHFEGVARVSSGLIILLDLQQALVTAQVPGSI